MQILCILYIEPMLVIWCNQKPNMTKKILYYANYKCLSYISIYVNLYNENIERTHILICFNEICFSIYNNVSSQKQLVHEYKFKLAFKTNNKKCCQKTYRQQLLQLHEIKRSILVLKPIYMTYNYNQVTTSYKIVICT